MKQHVDIPYIDTTRITDDLLKKVEVLRQSLAAENIVEAEQAIEVEYNISTRAQRRYKTELRNLFEIPPRASLIALSQHDQIRQALEFILTRKERTDRLQLRSAKKLNIIASNGDLISIEAYLKAQYPNETTSMVDVYESLIGLHTSKRIVNEAGELISRSDLPAEVSVCRFLRNWRKEFVAVRMGKSRKKDWERDNSTYITRNMNNYKAGEIWIGDHTELDFMVINEQGKPDRRWITTFIDMKTRLLVGYHLSWQPNSNTIALAFRNGVLGLQLKAAVNESEYKELHLNTIPETVMMDNGKDYRSRYTQTVFGKIDFDDKARTSVQRICKLHYTTPYHGQSKAQMERWFGTIQNMIRHLPGYKGNTYSKKPDSLKEDLKTGNILTVETFDAMVAWAINAYNNRIHSALTGQSPLQYYLTNAVINRTIDARVLDFLMLKVHRPNSKPPKIQRGQVTVNGVPYSSEMLVKYNDEFADVYYDPNEPGFVAVYVNGNFAAVGVNKLMASEDKNAWVQQLKDKKQFEKQLAEQLKNFRAPLTKEDRKNLILLGRLTNVSAVSQELLNKQIPTMTVFTGIEEQAKETNEAMEQTKEVVEIEERSKKTLRQTPLTMEQVSKIR